MRQPQWTIYEAAILLNGYLETIEKHLPKLRVVKRISDELRQMAVNNGMIIDDVFRNENGISYQIKSMESAYIGRKVYISATKLFSEIVEIYHNNRQQYDTILKKARNMIEPSHQNIDTFLAWSASDTSVKSSKWIEHNLLLVEKYGNNAGIISGSLFNVTDVSVLDLLFRGISKSKPFQIINKKIYKYIVQDLQSYRDYLCSLANDSDEIGQVIVEAVADPTMNVGLISNSSVQSQLLQPAPSEHTQKTKYDKNLLDATEVIISTRFVNGMRKNAAIAKKRFKNAYLELTGSELPESIDIDDLAADVGFEYSKKIYAVSIESKGHIKALIRTAIENGNHVIFYDEVYKQNADFMTTAGIFSSDLLKIVLKQLLPKFCYKRASFSMNKSDTLDSDIIACYDGKLLLSYDEIKSMLPYADMAQIRFVCSRNSRFVWAKEETYALAERLHLSEADINESMRVIANDISNQGFSVFQRISAHVSVELNPYIPEAALKEAIYSLHLSTAYERKHSIITLPGASFSPSAVMYEYCNSLSEATLAELQSYEDELTSKTSFSLSAAYSTMIRVDKERFVSKDSLSFDIAAIDSVLALFVRNEIIPLKSVNSFTSFPEVAGYFWNSFLLDSYCKHFSIRFQSMGGPAKSKPVGAIFAAQMHFSSYDDLLARVAAKSNILLNADEVSQYFTENAYTLRKIDANGITAKAQEIRIQGG